MRGLQGATVVVTGAAGGIGRAIALRLAEEGAGLALLDLAEQGLADAATAAGERGVRVTTTTLDVTDGEAVRAAVDRAADEHDGLHGVVNVAGTGLFAPYLELDEQHFRRTIEVNLLGTHLVTQAAARHLVEAGRGAVVNVSSVAARLGHELLAHYAAAKGGVLAFTRSTARALAPHGITVNAVCPGLLWTDMWEASAAWLLEHDPGLAGADLSARQVFDGLVGDLVPLRRPQEPADVAATVAFLLSDEARNITGQALNIDGGLSMD